MVLEKNSTREIRHRSFILLGCKKAFALASVSTIVNAIRAIILALTRSAFALPKEYLHENRISRLCVSHRFHRNRDCGSFCALCYSRRHSRSNAQYAGSHQRREGRQEG